MKKPIILIGSPRSGTTLIGDILNQHPSIAYWIEPKYIWKYKKPILFNDIRGKDEADNDVKNYIRSKFSQYLIRQNKSRFLEKTPSNCFRIPFINEIFNDAIFINIIRDGRDAILSSYIKWTTKHDKTAYKRRLTYNEIPLIDFPFYFVNFIKQLLLQEIKPNYVKQWGPMTPKIREYAKNSILEACAIQWKLCTEISINHLNDINPSRVYNFKYEDFLINPEKILNDIHKHCELDPSGEVYEYANSIIRPQNTKKWQKSHNKKIVEEISYIIDPTLEKLGYK